MHPNFIFWISGYQDITADAGANLNSHISHHQASNGANSQGSHGATFINNSIFRIYLDQN